MKKLCYNCLKPTAEEMYKYPICDSCKLKLKLKLISEGTLKKHYLKNPDGFSNEIQRRLDFIEKDFITKKIKLLDVKEKLKKF